MQCGKISALYKEHYRQICSADEEKPGHLAAIICPDGLNESMIDVAKCLIRHGTKILCFTKSFESPLGKLSDHVLLLADDPMNDMMWGEPEVSFMVSYKYLTDVLFYVEYSERRRMTGSEGFRKEISIKK